MLQLLTRTRGPSPAELTRFQEAVASAAATLSGQDLPLQAFSDPACPSFAALPAKARETSLLSAECYAQVLAEMADAAEDLRDSPRLLWRMLRKMGYIPRPDLLDKITGEDVVEIYNVHNRQLFRNLKFFEFCSFALGDVLGADWTQVTRRDQKISLDALAMVLRIKTGLLRDTLCVDHIPEHLVHELGGERRSYRIQFRFVSPLGGRPEAPKAFVIVHRTRWP
ncbi:MAG: hypothetical protein IT285_04835 [Bdellovibrionales bacterium]|nr:hypothetical protein [Bdellovibrionales bacterium]